MTLIRALVAVGLSVIFPGAGHVLLRDWIRALLFAGIFVSAIAFVFPVEAVMAAGSTGDVSAAIAQDLSQMDRFILSFVVLFTAVDAGLRGANFAPGSATESDGPSCPQCGRELDRELDFCHWCTTRLPSDRESHDH